MLDSEESMTRFFLGSTKRGLELVSSLLDDLSVVLKEGSEDSRSRLPDEEDEDVAVDGEGEAEPDEL